MYKECLNCPKIGISCDGPNFVALTAAETLEWCKLRKNHLKMSNAKLSEISGVPKGTIDRLLSGEHLDFKYESVRPILRALIGGSFDGNPCPDPHEEDNQKQAEAIEALKAENAALKERISNFDHIHREGLQQVRSEAQQTIDYLKAQVKDRKIVVLILSIGLALTLLTIIVALLIDRANPDKGFFWLEDQNTASVALSQLRMLLSMIVGA